MKADLRISDNFRYGLIRLVQDTVLILKLCCECDAKFSDFIEAEYFLTYDLKLYDDCTLV